MDVDIEISKRSRTWVTTRTPPSGDYEIRVRLPSDRNEYGKLSLFDGNGALIFGPVDVLGRSASNLRESINPDGDPTLTFGNTPTGEYNSYVRSSASIQASTGRPYYSALSRSGFSTYGGQGLIALDPSSGQALEAKQNGRTGLMIHAGGLRNGELRPTGGCLRVSPSDMAFLTATLYSISSLSGKDGSLPFQGTVKVYEKDDPTAQLSIEDVTSDDEISDTSETLAITSRNDFELNFSHEELNPDNQRDPGLFNIDELIDRVGRFQHAFDMDFKVEGPLFELDLLHKWAMSEVEARELGPGAPVEEITQRHRRNRGERNRSYPDVSVSYEDETVHVQVEKPIFNIEPH